MPPILEPLCFNGFTAYDLIILCIKISYYIDDGYTGTNFDRPGLRAMMAEIEAGHIGVVIVKDMSRFGRDYLQVGYYTEMFFPERGIRFIAVVNDVDSKKPSSSNDFLLCQGYQPEDQSNLSQPDGEG